jgi:hypothetical protein
MEYKFKMKIVVTVEAEDLKEAFQLARTSTDNWHEWDYVDSTVEVIPPETFRER